MPTGEDGNTQAPAAPASREAAILRHEPSRRDVFMSIDWPAMLYLAFFVHFVLLGSGLSSGIAAPLAVVVSFLFSATFARLVSGTKLVIVDAGTITFQGLWKSEIALADIARVTLQKRGEWGPARVSLEMKRSKPRSFWRLDLTTRVVLLPGDVRFQAEIVDAILARRPDAPVDERALRLLGGKLPVLLRHRLPTLIAASIGALAYAVFLVASYSQVYVAPWWYGVLVLPVFGVPSTQCLERESPARRAIASLGVGAPTPVAMVSMATLLYGGLEYVPTLLAAGLALAVGAFVAALPRGPSAKTVAVGTLTLLVALVGLTWYVTLAGTIPVREVLLAPPPWNAAFSPDGGTLVTYGQPVGREGVMAAVHFLDMDAQEASTVALGAPTGTLYWLTALSDGRALLRADLDGGKGLWSVTVQGQVRKAEVPGSCKLIWLRALTPDGRLLAIHQAYEVPTSARLPRHLRHYVNRFLLLDTEVGELDAAPFEIAPDHAFPHGLAWRADGRLVWGGVEEEESGVEENRGVFCLRSWVPGEDEPRVEFESREQWSGTGLSPRCDKAVTYVHRSGTPTSAVVSLADGRITEVPGLEPHITFYPSAHWSEDASIYVFVPEAEPQTIRILRAATGEVSTLHRAPLGEVSSTLVSPDGQRVAFSVTLKDGGAIFIADTASGKVRRLRPVATFMVMLEDLAGCAAWSPDGKWLAIPAVGSRLALTGSTGKGPLWLVSADDM